MGTRCLTYVYDNNDKPIIKLYRQHDGYPSGHGRELAEFLTSIKEITNGFSPSETRRIANGMGCLAAQLVAHFKTGAGGFYLYPVDVTDCGQDYEYHVFTDRVGVKDSRGDVLFEGSWKKFRKFCAEGNEDD